MDEAAAMQGSLHICGGEKPTIMGIERGNHGAIMRAVVLAVSLAAIVCSAAQAGTCQHFSASTMKANSGPAAKWRTDYPTESPDPNDKQLWESIDFRTKPSEYMRAALAGARDSFRIEDRKLVGTGQEAWWISQWLDYGTSGREPLMGLTKERGPDAGDLSEANGGGYQVWAVGFYNLPGAVVIGEVFSQPCNSSLPVAVKFPSDTVSVKFLFTDASVDEVTYLKDAPEYDAYVDPIGSGRVGHPASERTVRPLRLLQVDISVKDPRSRETGWVFATFVWKGPPQGDKLFDNLVPVALQWGNDPNVYDTSVQQSWVNTGLRGVTFGWDKRATMGFMGRANGPADNIRSSCLSCHAAARTPRASIGILDNGFDMTQVNDPARVKAHVDTWFQNIKGGQLFQPFEPAASSLDYSLQLEAAIFRMCAACKAGDLAGPTPDACRLTGFYNRPACTTAVDDGPLKQALQIMPPPRQ
ncbi:hypothetical protein GOC46_28895 [Sinorhizobium meliloti]|nr:hypothetical protein [Sinorhizobium meliloti]MDX0384146.1 hypothetical protein [Sinorhizobium meliloti]